MDRIVLSVADMSCSHCVRTVSAAVRDVSGVRTVEACLEERVLYVEGGGLSRVLLQEALAAVGYDAIAAPAAASPHDGSGRREEPVVAHVVDLSHPIRAGMTTYPGLPGPRVTTYVSREQSAERLEHRASFHIGRVDMVANTGTYLDAPYHFHESGADVAQVPVERLADLPCVVVEATGHRAIPPTVLPQSAAIRGAAVLFRTGWSTRWGTPEYAEGSPFLSRATVGRLREAAPVLVGIDALNVDDTADLSRPAHHGLLGDGILVVEHLTNLDLVPEAGARFTALPAPVAGMGTMPVRAVAVLPGTAVPSRPETPAGRPSTKCPNSPQVRTGPAEWTS